jgi:hypothetical protein
MSSQKCCPVKFGTAVNTEGLLIEVPCMGKECAWFFDNHCAVLMIAKEWCTNQKKKAPKGMSAAWCIKTIGRQYEFPMKTAYSVLTCCKGLRVFQVLWDGVHHDDNPFQRCQLVNWIVRVVISPGSPCSNVTGLHPCMQGSLTHSHGSPRSRE